MGWERSPLGYPLTDEQGTPDGVGRFNLFQNGAIYWTPGTGAFEVRGAIHVLWAQLGSERSALGYPLSNEETTPDRHSQHTRFQGGDIWWDAHRGAYEVLTRPAFPRPDPAVGGAWAVAPFTADISGLHAALLPTGARGSVWFLSYLDETGHGHHDPQPAHDGESRVLDLATRTASTPGYEGPHDHLPNLFCGGHAFLPDGRLLMVGGDREDQDRLRMLHTFTPGGPGGGRWRDVDRMAQGRWYASAVDPARRPGPHRGRGTPGVRSRAGPQPQPQLRDLRPGHGRRGSGDAGTAVRAVRGLGHLPVGVRAPR